MWKEVNLLSTNFSANTYAKCNFNINFSCLFWVSLWNNTIKEKYLKSRYNLYIPWYFKVRLISKLKNSNEINVCNYERLWIITWHFLWLIDLQNAWNIFKGKFTLFTYIRCKLCTHQYECVDTKMIPS